MLHSDNLPGQFGLPGIKPAQVEQVLTTQVTKFAIGGRKIEFSIHSGLISALSTRLHSLIQTSQADGSKEDCVPFEDVDDDVFSRFVQFAYCGSYAGFDPAGEDLRERSSGASTMDATGSTKSIDDPDSLPTGINTGGRSSGFGLFNFGYWDKPIFGQTSVIQPTGGPPEQLSERQGTTRVFGQSLDRSHLLGLPYSLASWTTTATDEYCSQVKSQGRVSCNCELRKPRRHGKKQEYVSKFMRAYVPVTDLWQNVRQSRPDPRSEHFKYILIGHVRVWAFARRFAVEPLMGLSCINLARELVYWVMSVQTFMPIFGELVRFIYGSCEGGKLRLLVAQFATCVVEDVSHLEGWDELLTEVPAFAVGLVRELADRYA
ncbi:hypothetical protein CEP51_013192 [Fusarium floridanum]|uniref:BTB domain-containing protein n=1 Tax=Fusarium floridanum TaxID=1325733 RepID=A0A428QFT8_9HYPO|nr:hypothetical protein CEP51_013192 [Fusarium floridanum]